MEHFAGPIPWPSSPLLWPGTERLLQASLAGPHWGPASLWLRGHGIDLGAPIKGFPARAQRQRVGWGEEEQGSGRSFRRQAETETSGLCDDDGAAPNGAYKRFVPRTKPWRKGGSAALSISIPTGPRKMEHFAGPIPWPSSPLLWPGTERLLQASLAGPHTGGPLFCAPPGAAGGFSRKIHSV